MADPTTPTPPVGLSDETLNRLSSVLEGVGDRLATPPPAVSAPKADELDEDIQNLDPEVAKAVVKLVEKKTEVLKQDYVKDQKKKEYNTRLDTEFPEIANTNSALYKETVKELNKRLADNPRYTDDVPSAFYDAACAAALRLGHTKRPQAPAPSPEERRISSITGGYMPNGSTPPPQVKHDDVTEEQAAYANRFGISPEVYKNFEGSIDGYGRVTTKNPGRRQ